MENEHKKIILSKKGFDHSYGGRPSLIDGLGLISMPIPDSKGTHSYSDLKISANETICDVATKHFKTIQNDDGKKIELKNAKCHPDPNLVDYFESEKNGHGFLGSFGQMDTAQAHLQNQGIKENDIFLFYGWFEKDGKKIHVINGYLQIGEKHLITEKDKAAIVGNYPFLKEQPHLGIDNPTNTIYLAREKCTFDETIKGYGTFQFHKDLVLTRDGADTQRDWQVPKLAGLGISWNGKRKFNDQGQITVTKGYGQEFVLQESEQAEMWAVGLIQEHAKGGK
jgi:hypothetical protein